jgi:hypothetical protein
MRLLWLGMTILGLLYGSAAPGNVRAGENSEKPLHEQPLYNDELSMALPKDWRLVRSEPPGILKYDDLLYYVQLGSRRLITIEYTNNENFGFTYTATLTNVQNHGISVTEYRRDDVLMNIVAKPPCGGFRYILMWPTTDDPAERRQIEASMKSLTCLASPRPER